MLPGEPSWLVVLEPGPSGRTIRIETGADPDPPEVSEGDGVTVVFDGFLVDRDRPDPDAASHIRAAYLQHGENVLPSLRGAFALTIWDARSGRLLGVRDPTGPHPLFYARDGDRLLVASSHGALLRAGVSRDPDRVAIARWVMFGESLPETTFYEAIRRLPPGHLLEATRNRFEVRRHWWPLEPPIDMRSDELVARFERALDKAVERLVPLGPIGVLLSGGVDSASVAAAATAVARAASAPDPIALSVVFPDEASSEEVVQRSTAEALGIPQTFFPLAGTVPDGKLLAAGLRMTRECWTPPVNPWAAAYEQVARDASRLGCTTLLGGEGGNQWYETDRDEAADLVRSFRVRSLAELWSHERKAGWSGAGAARELVWDYGLRTLLRDAALKRSDSGRVREFRRRRLLAGVTTPDPTLAAAIVEAWLDDGAAPLPGGVRRRADGRRLNSVALVVSLEERFRYGRAAGVRVLDPPLDPEVVSSLYGLPVATLEMGNRPKGLVRRSLDGRLGIPATRRLGLASPAGYFASLIRDEAARALEQLGGLPRLTELGILDGPVFANALSRSRTEQEIGYYQAWQALACETWLQSHA